MEGSETVSVSEQHSGLESEVIYLLEERDGLEDQLRRERDRGARTTGVLGLDLQKLQAERDAAERAAADEIARMETFVEVARMEKADAVEDALYLLDSERVLLERLHALEDARPVDASVKALRGEAAFLRATLESVKQERAALRCRVSEQAKAIAEVERKFHARGAEEETRKLRERVFYLEQLCVGKEAQVAGLERGLAAARERGGVEDARGSAQRVERKPSRVPFFNPRTDDIWSVAGAAMGCILIVFLAKWAESISELSPAAEGVSALVICAAGFMCLMLCALALMKAALLMYRVTFPPSSSSSSS
eukprot:CAMPEP_0180237022 /NCGR_PEP_ID=MMETSP0987-20121128/30120_1 /TAXON_ID=697907 /ORGANISM="non described non described, Strain CCMP2293" /LENGTH=307 /DNA_ID=CAMNT_0022203345 /DNA_START=169 /DNA_END=1088 /DNA_ORIENTATION=+